MDTFSMALQCQVKDAFSVIQDKSEAMKVEALTTVCAGEWWCMLNNYSVSCIHNFVAKFLPLFPNVQLSDFVLLKYQGDYSF